jgi:hypothetical protein
VSRNNTLSETLFALAVWAGHHGVASFISVLDLFVEILSVARAIKFLMPNRFGRGTVQMHSGKRRVTTFHSTVSTVKLGPCLFKEADPELTIVWTCEAGFAVHSGDVIINNDWGLDSVDVDTHKVDTSLIGFLVDKTGLDILGLFCHGAKAGEVVAIAEAALIDVIGFNAISKDFGVFKDLCGTLPLDSAHAHKVTVVVATVDETRKLGWELGVSPLLTLLNDFLDKSPFLFHKFVAQALFKLELSLVLFEVALIFGLLLLFLSVIVLLRGLILDCATDAH